MCGIAGFINYPEGSIEKTQNLLMHRGPDAQTSYSFNNVRLIHTRLSIQDIANGAQPFIIGNYVIVFNGEIYNHLKLREKVKRYKFKTQSDTETLLALYIEHGDKALKMCDGMFAFAIFNNNLNILVLGRDRAGKKPLYYYKKNESIIFSSELKVISNCVSKLKINDNEVNTFLRNGFFYGQSTPFQDVFEVEPGSILEINLDKFIISKNKYFDIQTLYKKNKINDINIALEEVERKLELSVKDRLLSSDVEVGAFLSGGIDSSLIVAMASKYKNNLKTFTVKFESSFDESWLSKLTAQKYSTDHNEIQISMNLRDDVEKILLNYGEPFMDSSAIPSYYVSREAKKYVNVVLNGDGADELFGGYRRYVPIANNWIKFSRYFSKFSTMLPKPKNKLSKYNYLYRLLRLSNKDGLDFYNSATNDIFDDECSFTSNSTVNNMEEFIDCINRDKISDLSKMLILDFNFILPNDLLKKMDIATMSNSLEGRSPFLSKYMLELAPTLNDKFKVEGLKTKVILRELGKKYLPSKIVKQPKRGFEVPLKKWVNFDLKDNICDSLSGECYSNNFFSHKFIDLLINNKIHTTEEKRAKMLWTLFCLEIWKKNL